MAKVLLDSCRRFHPECDSYLCLADLRVPSADFYPEGTQVITAAELGIPQFEEFAFRYDIMEFNTAVKPFVFRKLLQRGYDFVLYFDPDIEIFSELTDVMQALEQGASFVLTPHLCRPAEGDAYPGDVGIMKAGIYNLGFLGVGATPETMPILRWWCRRLQYQCINDQANGIFVDQRFMDLVPGFAEHARVLRSTALNVAYWNLAQRQLDFDGQRWLVDGEPLGFFHFSGFDPNHPDRLSKHTSAFRGHAMRGHIRHLCEHYTEKLVANRHGSIPSALYGYGNFASGSPIPTLVRRMFRERHQTWSGANPFEAYEEYLHLPALGPAIESSTHVVTNLMAFLRESNVGLQAAFDTTRPHGASDYVRWYIDHAPEWLEDERLATPVSVRAGRVRPVRRPPRATRTEPDVTVAGYLRATSGVGEAGRLALGALHKQGIRAEGVDIDQHPAANNEDSVGDLLTERGRGRFQLFHVNADMLPSMIDHLKPVLRSDAYRIVVPFWELARFPDAWVPAFDRVDEVWAPTKFIQRAIVRRLPGKPVIHMPLPLRAGQQTRALPRSRFGLPDDAFLFFFSFDYFSYVERKNPLAGLRAFKRAFGCGDYGRVGLVIKTLNADRVSDKAAKIRDALAAEKDVFLVEDLLSREDVLGLLAATDAVLSLHRSEGLGLLIAEAFALGKPVVATDYSATTELVTPATGYPVSFRLVPVAEGEYPFPEGQVWADPDIEHAAWQMRRLVTEESERTGKVKAAQAFLERHHAAVAAGARYQGRLREIERQSAAFL
jgi:glycosyltransferase involved in cell wall biosynthesis